MSTRYYFAARYSRNPEMRGYRDQLEAATDASVTSRWIDCHDDELEVSYTPEQMNAAPNACWTHGQSDVDDMWRADVIVSFTGNGGGGKGGRHIKHGYMLARSDMRNHPAAGPRIVVIGPRENIFHCHPGTEVYPDFAAFLAHETRPTA